jgi:5'-3' exonuclease
MATKKPKLAICDCDGLIFTCAWSLRHQMTNIGKMAAKKKLDELISAIFNRIEADHYVGFYGADKSVTFRHKWATQAPYKGHRKSEPWHDFFKNCLKEHFKNKWGFYEVRDIEADDAVIIAFHQYKEDYDIVMVGDDKDVKQLGKITKFNPRNSSIEKITHEEGRKFFYSQWLYGDSVDGIKSIKGIGEKAPIVKALYELENPTEGEMFELVRDKYIEVYGEEYLYHMIENYLLLNMLTKPSFDYPEEVVLQKVEKKKSILKSLNI